MKYIFLTSVFFLTSITATAQPLANEIVFEGRTESSHLQIYSMRADGSGQISLTDDLNFPHYNPSWSRDGAKIVYIKNGDMSVMNADGTNQQSIGIVSDEMYNPRWSPDGSKIAFFANIGFKPPFIAIFVVNANGSNLTQLPGSGYDYGPDWSPDGSKLVFSTLTGISMMNADGTGRSDLINLFDTNNPRWSPDGSKIAFTRNGAIYVMNTDGTGQTAITNCPNCYDFSPTWSPDGTRLAFVSNRNGPYYGIYVMNADGSNIVRITQNAFNSFAPDWKRAAPAQHQLSGRVTTSSQRGVPRARVTLDDGAGNIRSAITNPFGYFRFENVPTGSYAASVRSKSYTFVSRTVDVSSSITDLDFVALENP